MKYILGTLIALSFGMASCAAAESNAQTPPEDTSSEQSERPERAERGERGERGEKGGERRKPPQEAFDACLEKAVDATCSVETPRGQMDGTCMAGRRDKEVLICRPERGSRPPK